MLIPCKHEGHTAFPTPLPICLLLAAVSTSDSGLLAYEASWVNSGPNAEDQQPPTRHAAVH